MRLQNFAAAERELIEDCLTLMEEARVKIEVISKPIETEDEIFSRIMLLNSMSLLVLRISDSLSEDIKFLPGYRDRSQLH